MDEQALNRIERMEAALDRSIVAAEALGQAMEEMTALKEEMTALFHYYGSEEWFADCQRELPPGTKAGVLSEDLVYNTLMTVREEALDMLELAAEILRSRI